MASSKEQLNLGLLTIWSVCLENHICKDWNLNMWSRINLQYETLLGFDMRHLLDDNLGYNQPLSCKR